MSHALTRPRHAVGELAADARRGRPAAGPGDCRGPAVLVLFGDRRRDRLRSGILLVACTHRSGCRLRSSRAGDSSTGTGPAFRSISSTPVRSGRSCSSASRWRTTRSLARRCTWCRRSPGVRLRLSVPVAVRGRVDRGLPHGLTASNGRPEAGSSSGLDRSATCGRSSLCSRYRWAGPPLQARLLARRVRTDGLDWPGVVRSGGRRGGAAAPRRRAGSHTPDERHRRDSRTGSSPCSGSRVPPRLRRGRRCGST